MKVEEPIGKYNRRGMCRVSHIRCYERVRPLREQGEPSRAHRAGKRATSALTSESDISAAHRQVLEGPVSDNRCVSFGKADQHRADRSAIDPTPKLRKINYLPTMLHLGVSS
jgi:hypothetical protein